MLDPGALAPVIGKWMSDNPGQPVPQGARDLITEPMLQVPFAAPGSRVPIKIPRDFNRNEVEPDVGAGTIITYTPAPSTSTGETPVIPASLVDELNSPEFKAQAEACGDAVRKLRETVNYDFYQEDRITGFDRVCLFAQSSKDPPPLDEQQTKLATECADAYGAYVKSCFSPSVDDKLFSRVGILVGFNYPVTNQDTILCTATLLAGDTLITAKHCLAPLASPTPGFSLRFYSLGDNKQLGVKRIWLFRGNSGWQAMSIEDAGKALASEKVTVASDLALLSVDHDDGITDDPPTLSAPVPYERLEMGGFQRLVANAIQLRARLERKTIPTDTDLIVSGLWKNAFRLDASPVCVAVPFDTKDNQALEASPGVAVGHFCQSLGSASGSPLFALAGIESPTPVLQIVAIHSRGVRDQVHPISIAPETYRPRNAAVALSSALLDPSTLH
jgi:hypothetical protein